MSSDIQLPNPVPNLGPHLQSNAAAAARTALALGIPPADVVRRLEEFDGVRRRYEVLRDGPATWIDDYAHHPTAIDVTLQQARIEAGVRPLIAVFEPHQAARLRAFGGRFAEALNLADELFLTPVFAAREPSDDGTALNTLRRSLTRPSTCVADLDQLAGLLQTRLDRDPAACCVVLGAGRIGRFLDERFSHLRGRHRRTGLVRGDRAG